MKAKTQIQRPHYYQKSQLKIIIFSVLLLAIFLSMYVFRGLKTSSEMTSRSEVMVGKPGNDFNLKGVISFYSENSDSITSIYVEIADNDRERQKGLMYRENIPDTVGMLFIFPDMEPRSFWMRNTPTSLDIMYADSQSRIVSIYENTLPNSDESLPSGDEAQYVIETKAGFCARFGIRKGDVFRYRKGL